MKLMKNSLNSFNSIEFIKQLELMLEIEQERKHLREIGLSEIEIEGYFECFAENFIDVKETVDENC